MTEECLNQPIIKHKNVILEGDHGRPTNHATLTAKAVLDLLMAKSHDQYRLGLVISTDLSVA